MRDRLTELQGFTFTPAVEESRPEENHTAEDVELVQQAIVFEGEDVMDGIYKEAQALRKEMMLLKLDVSVSGSRTPGSSRLSGGSAASNGTLTRSDGTSRPERRPFTLGWRSWGS